MSWKISRRVMRSDICKAGKGRHRQPTLAGDLQQAVAGEDAVGDLGRAAIVVAIADVDHRGVTLAIGLHQEALGSAAKRRARVEIGIFEAVAGVRKRISQALTGTPVTP